MGKGSTPTLKANIVLNGLVKVEIMKVKTYEEISDHDVWWLDPLLHVRCRVLDIGCLFALPFYLFGLVRLN